MSQKFNPLSSMQTSIFMTLWENITEGIKQDIFDYISEGHAFIINNALQTFFFMMAIIKLISWALNKLNLFFAHYISESNYVKGAIFIVFLYLKVWKSYAAHMEILGYFCSVSVCIHLYEGCIRMGTHFCQRYSKNGFGNISSLISVILIFLSYKVFALSQVEQKENKYPYVALYFLVFGLILVITLLKRKQFIYALIIMTMAALLILLRQWTILLLKDTLLCKSNLPLESVVYLLFAIQQNYNAKEEEKKLQILQGEIKPNEQKVRVSDLFLAQIYYFVFFLINKRIYNIEIVFVTVCCLNYLGFRRFE